MTYKPIFQNSLQHAFELFGNGSRVFQNSLNARASPWPCLCPGPTICIAAPSIIFRFSSFGNFHPLFCRNTNNMSCSTFVILPYVYTTLSFFCEWIFSPITIEMSVVYKHVLAMSCWIPQLFSPQVSCS